MSVSLNKFCCRSDGFSVGAFEDLSILLVSMLVGNRFKSVTFTSNNGGKSTKRAHKFPRDNRKNDFSLPHFLYDCDTNRPIVSRLLAQYATIG